MNDDQNRGTLVQPAYELAVDRGPTWTEEEFRRWLDEAAGIEREIGGAIDRELRAALGLPDQPPAGPVPPASSGSGA